MRPQRQPWSNKQYTPAIHDLMSQFRQFTSWRTGLKLIGFDLFEPTSKLCRQISLLPGRTHKVGLQHIDSVVKVCSLKQCLTKVGAADISAREVSTN